MRLLLSILMLAMVLMGCQSQEKSADAPDARDARDEPKKAESFTGRLQSGVVAIGGEHTGWVLAGDGASGGIEVDVSKVKEQAKANDGKRVTIAGRMVERKYVERGKVQVLVAEGIAPAPAGGAAGAGR